MFNTIWNTSVTKIVRLFFDYSALSFYLVDRIFGFLVFTKPNVNFHYLTDDGNKFSLSLSETICECSRSEVNISSPSSSFACWDKWSSFWLEFFFSDINKDSWEASGLASPWRFDVSSDKRLLVIWLPSSI